MIALSTLFDMAFPQLMYSWSTPGVTPGRAAGFFINANKASEAVILTALLAMPALRTATALPLAVLAGMAVLVTFSRTGMVAWVVLIGLYWTGGLLRRGHLLAMAALAVLLVAGGSLLALLVESQDLPTIAAADITDRLRFLGTGDLSDDSAQSRGAVVREGIDLFLRNPLVGAGSGATHVWDFGLAPHNFAVLMAAEYGVVGHRLLAGTDRAGRDRRLLRSPRSSMGRRRTAVDVLDGDSQHPGLPVLDRLDPAAGDGFRDVGPQVLAADADARDRSARSGPVRERRTLAGQSRAGQREAQSRQARSQGGRDAGSPTFGIGPSESVTSA